MYGEDENKRETLKGVFIKLVLVVLLIFVLMMLFPTKGFVTNYVDEKVKENSGSDNFNNNLLAMATAGSGYFTSSRLPKDTGDKVKMTLGEMYKDKLLVRFTDSNNRTCNTNESYLEVTKEDSEYTMKVNLSCSDKEDYIMLHMGLDGTSFPSTSTARCEFVKNLDDTWSYGNWSSWSTKKVTENSTRQVQTKVSKVQTGTKQVPHTSVREGGATKVLYNGYVKYVCPTGYDNAGVYDNVVTCKKSTTTYTTEPVYKNVTYYRYRDKTLSSNVDTKWSDCDDNSLIEQGYVKTGKED